MASSQEGGTVLSPWVLRVFPVQPGKGVTEAIRCDCRLLSNCVCFLKYWLFLNFSVLAGFLIHMITYFFSPLCAVESLQILPGTVKSLYDRTASDERCLKKTEPKQTFL